LRLRGAGLWSRADLLPLDGGGLMVRHAHHRGGGETRTYPILTVTDFVVVISALMALRV